jgi:simple sugar transport system permease protein/ribose transport system permease protein
MKTMTKTESTSTDEMTIPFGENGALLREKRVDRQNLIVPLGVGGAATLILVIGWLTTPAFLTTYNLLQVVRSGALIGIAALGTTFITLSGSYFSLSVQQTAMFCAISFAGILSWGWGLPAALFLTLLLALALGLIQGWLVSIGANPIISTLGAGAVIYGIAAVATNNKVVRTGTDIAEWIGRGRPLGIPNQTYALVILAIVAAIVLKKTRFGRLIMLVGSSHDAARASGLSVGLATIAAFSIASVAAGISGIFVAAQISQGRVDQFSTFTMDVIAAVLVAGTSLQGGEGSALRTTMGTIFIALLSNLLLLSGQPYGVRIFVLGMFVILGVSAFHLLRQRTL